MVLHGTSLAVACTEWNNLIPNTDAYHKVVSWQLHSVGEASKSKSVLIHQ